MADLEGNLKVEDTPFNICPGKQITRLEFNEKLNIILAGSSTGDLYIVDPILGEILYQTVVGGDTDDEWAFSTGAENIVVANKDKIGIRSEYNGIFLLDSILQTPVKTNSENIQIELSKSEAETLSQALSTFSPETFPEVELVGKHMKSILYKSDGEINDRVDMVVSIKREKWATVKLELPQTLLKTAFKSMMDEWCKKTTYIPSLTSASSILDRANQLLVEETPETDPPLDKTLMFSEAARFATFANWPHADYKWALPDKMAQARFYHSPASTGDDRSMCFTCNVCLVSWEPTDEPWSEHERHSPFCPYVRGEHTHNVPLSIQHATAPAYMSKKHVQKPIIGKSSQPNCTAVAFTNGLVLIWEGTKQRREPIELEISPKMMETLEPTKQHVYTDIDLKNQSGTGTILEAQGSPMNLSTASEKGHGQYEKIQISSIAVLGLPSKFSIEVEKENKTVSPSLVVASSLKTPKSVGKPESQSAFMLTYALNFTVSKPPAAKSTPPTKEQPPPYSSGSKQECQESEDDLFGSYTSECDLLSDSISIFDDLNMSDLSGTFILEAPMELDSTQTDSSKLKTPVAANKTAPPPKNKTPASTTKTASVSSIVLAQRLNLPAEFQQCSNIINLTPSLDGSQLVTIVASTSANQVQGAVFGAFIVYNVILECNMVVLDRQNFLCKKIERPEELPVSTCLVPSEYGESELCCVLKNGSVRIINLVDLSTVFSIRPAHGVSSDKIITSASYCSNLGRLYCGTNSGIIEMYSLGSPETSESEADPTVRELRPKSRSAAGAAASKAVDDPRLISNRSLSLESLKQLLQLTMFESKSCFTASAPPCWLKVVQAQKERKHPQHLQHLEKDGNANTLTWRLQRAKNSQKEHLLEITLLPNPTVVGHLDLKVLLHGGCTMLPTIQVTLYRISKKSRVSSNEVDSRIDFASQLKNKTSIELFLKSVGAEIVCGPLDLTSFMDLSCQSANIVMTSPELLLSKTRNFYLHIRAKLPPETPGTPAPQQSEKEKAKNSPRGSQSQAQSPYPVVPSPKSFSSPAVAMMAAKSKSVAMAAEQAAKYHKFMMNPSGGVNFGNMDFSSAIPIPIPQFPNSPVAKLYDMGPNPNANANEADTAAKPNDLVGCDWIHELSISIRQVKRSTIANEDVERKSMLTSSLFVSKLLDISILRTGGEQVSYAEQSIALDLLVWIASINLCGPQIGNQNSQVRLLKEVRSKLKELILWGILSADRSTAHKCARLLVTCMDAAELYHPEEKPFLNSVLKSLLELLPFTISSVSAGSLQWFFLLLSRAKDYDLCATSETILELLGVTSKELNKRSNPFHALLRTRFGLYGLPFDADVFELELPAFVKTAPSNALSNAYAGVYAMSGMDPSMSTGTTTSSHLWGLKDLDFRDLLSSNPVAKLGKLGFPSPKQQIHGLLEVEPLHFTCHAASDGTRIEKIDQGPTSSFTTVPLPQPFEPFTNLQTGEGSKKSEPDKMEQIMMLQKALKMEHGEAYFDVLNDLKYYENDIGSGVGKTYKFYAPYNKDTQLSQHFSSHVGAMGIPPAWKSENVLTVVLQPSKHVNPSAGSSIWSSTSTFGPPPPILPSPFPFGMGGGDPNLPVSISISGHPHVQPITAKPLPALPSSGAQPPPPKPSAQPSATPSSSQPKVSSPEDDELRLLLSPWQQMMYVPPQQALVIDRMHSGARRFVVLDFGSPILLTDLVIPASSDLVSLSIDIWLHREETDGQRLIVASDIGRKPLVISDLQPPPICRYLKITAIGRYGMGNTKCKIPVGMFYGHTTILPHDLNVCDINTVGDVSALSTANIQTHLSVLAYLVEDLGCRHQLACLKLKRLLEPLMKSDISPLDHISYYLPKGRERNKVGVNNISDPGITNAYQDAMILQQQLNVAKNVIKRLQKSLTLGPEPTPHNPLTYLSGISTDKVKLLNEFLIESLLASSPLSSPLIQTSPSPMYLGLNQKLCEGLFRDICVLENGQSQLSTCALMLRVCGFQSWWGKFLASTLKTLFSSSNDSMFPQDRVFILLVYLGQKSILCANNSSVVESIMELLQQLLTPLTEGNIFLRAKIDMTLLGWVILYFCLCLDGVNCTMTNGGDQSDGKGQPQSKKSKGSLSSRWDFIQGECALYRGACNSNKTIGPSVFKRRIQKKILATKQKLEELDTVASGLGYSNNLMQISGVNSHLAALGNKIEAIKQKTAGLSSSKTSKIPTAKSLKEIYQIRKNEFAKYCGGRIPLDDPLASLMPEVEVNLNLDPQLCLNLAKSLASLLLHMDSTCHSDIYLIVCKALARIATCSRPTTTLGMIFNSEQVVRLIVTAVGNDFVKQRSWSSSWISHAIICLLQDILEGERIFPSKPAPMETMSPVIGEAFEDDIMSAIEESITQDGVGDDMIIDEADALVNEVVEAANVQPMDSTQSLDSGDSDYADMNEELPFVVMTNTTPKLLPSFKEWKEKHQGTTSKRIPMRLTSISTALDARLETRVESTAELRLRLMSVLDSEMLGQALRTPAEGVEQYRRRKRSVTRISDTTEMNNMNHVDSLGLLSSCFDHIFLMLSSENCSISIERLLQLWISINIDSTSNDIANVNKPAVPLSRRSISALIGALSRNTGIGVQEWGLGFQCLALLAKQKSAENEYGDWHHILCDENFGQLLLKFISGSGLNAHKANVVSIGPTICQHFYNFLFRIWEHTSDACWTLYLKEILLRVLDSFLSLPILNTNFPLDAFNKFLDRLCAHDLSYESLQTIINIVQQFGHVLHQFVFYPNKITVRSNPSKYGSAAATSLSNSANAPDATPEKCQDLENVMFRLASLVSSIFALPIKSNSSLDENTQALLQRANIGTRTNYNIAEYIARCGEAGPKTVADLVLHMEPTVMRILSVLANPNGLNLLAKEELSTAFNSLDTTAPTNFIDSVVHLFNKLCNCASQPQWTVQCLFKFLSKSAYDDFYCPLIVSETFVLLVLKVIDKKEHLQQFIALNCVQSVCEKLVSSTQKFFSSCPTFVSILTQYIGRTDVTAPFNVGQKRFGGDSTELPEGLINVAPLGSISSTNFSAHPSEILLQPSPPHRRARSPVWSYHFFPEETFLELIVTLPCAVLLKEVQIVPHITSLSTTCPSAVMLEISRERNNLTIPMGPPIQCSGMSTINIQLNQPEVAQSVLVRMFKPKDSCNLGLSQIRVIGCTTFSEASMLGLSQNEDVKNLESSTHWMYILDRAISVSDEVLRRQVVSTAVNYPNILESCYSMLMAPLGNGKPLEVYLPHVASVLFHFGSCRKDISEQLTSALLGPVQMGFSHGMVVSPSSKADAGVSQLNTVVELLYNLCCHIPEWGFENLTSLINWLAGLADIGIQGNLNSKEIVPEYIQGVAAALWTVAEQRKVDLTEIVTADLLRKLFTWTTKLDNKSELKSALDHMICSVCFAKPWLFIYLMHCMGLVKEMDWVERDKPLEELIQQWFEEACVWERVNLQPLEFLKNSFSPGLLMTLGRVAQSPAAANMLHNSQMLGHLNAGIMDFLAYYGNLWSHCATSASLPPGVMSTGSMVSILEFFGELCRMNEFKNWFGFLGSVFWLPLLKMLSTLPGNLKAAYFGSQVYDLETVFISFLSKCCWTHPDNQNIIATCLCETIINQKNTTHKAIFLHSMSSFCRRLLIQLLLENEKVIVHVKSQLKYPLRGPNSSVPLHYKHPSMGVCGGDRIFLIGTHCAVGDMLKLIDPFDTSNELSKTITDSNRIWNMLRKEYHGCMEPGHSQELFCLNDEETVIPAKKIYDAKKASKMTSKKPKPDEQDQKAKEKRSSKPLVVESTEFPDCIVPHVVQLSSIISAVRQHHPDSILDTLVFTLRNETPTIGTAGQPQAAKTDAGTQTTLGGTASASTSTASSSTSTSATHSKEIKTQKSVEIPEIFKATPITSTVEVFSRLGGLALLARHLPVVYPETLRQIAVGSKAHSSPMSLEKEMIMNGLADDWVKIDSAEDFYEEMMEGMVSSSSGLTGPLRRAPAALRPIPAIPGIPPHSLAAFGLFLGLPRFADILLGEREGAQCMLRLVMGVTDDADGNNIFNTPVAKTLPTLPFNVLRCLLDVLPLTTEEGLLLRRAMIDIKAMHFILACFAIFTHQTCDPALVPGIQHELVIAATKAQSGYGDKTDKSDDKSHVYWAKGTGFGTGSTAQNWDIELAMQKKQIEEENVACFLQVLSSFIKSTERKTDTSGGPPNVVVTEIYDLLKQSCLLPAIASYLRNDSVLDMARHIPLYKSILLFLRSLVSNYDLLPLLLPSKRRSPTQSSDSDDDSISKLLTKMKTIVDNYSKRLTSSKKSKSKGTGGKTTDDLEDEGLAVLIPDIQSTAIFVEQTVAQLIKQDDVEMMDVGDLSFTSLPKSLEDKYVEEMKKLQFAFFDFTTENEDGTGVNFTVSYHYENNVKQNYTKSYPARLKRLAQESVTLSNSLPIAYGSTIFVRSDTDRLDVMKVLITGPSGTPYSNGCFEFDVYFPNDYPNSPMMVNLETTGRQRVRFNPNLYADGKVCLSILNTWHGRPEEKWNPQTSSLLTVLVAIQSLILTAEPYFNEPGYEKSRGTDSGERNSREYNAGIQIATLEWAMLDQIKHPSACFKEIVHHHFWLKKDEIIAQCEQWLADLIVTCQNDKKAGKSVTGSGDPVAVFKNNLVLLKKELAALAPIPGFEEPKPAASGDQSGGLEAVAEAQSPGTPSGAAPPAAAAPGTAPISTEGPTATSTPISTQKTLTTGLTEEVPSNNPDSSTPAAGSADDVLSSDKMDEDKQQ